MNRPEGQSRHQREHDRYDATRTRHDHDGTPIVPLVNQGEQAVNFVLAHSTKACERKVGSQVRFLR